MAVIAIVDLAHCGTTMTAGILERLGVPMVWKRTNGKLEDDDVAQALGTVKEPQNSRELARLVEQRGDLTWGFKIPGAWKFAPVLREHLRDPVYLAIYKDPVSVTLRRFGTVDTRRLAKTTRWMHESIVGIRECGLPVWWLSYLDAMRGPCQFVEHLAELAGVGVTGSQMDACLAWIRREAI